MNNYYNTAPLPYALYIHGMGSGAKSGTKSSLGHYLDGYEWLSPELPVEPEDAMAILEDYVNVFTPALIAGTSLGGLYLLYLDAPDAVMNGKIDDFIKAYLMEFPSSEEEN